MKTPSDMAVLILICLYDTAPVVKVAAFAKKITVGLYPYKMGKRYRQPRVPCRSSAYRLFAAILVMNSSIRVSDE